MNKLCNYLFFVIILFFSINALAEKSSSDPNLERVQKTITVLMNNNQIPGAAVLLYVNGQPYAYYFGYANVKKKIPVSAETIFEVGSISKVITSLLFAQELDIANMSLTDSVKKYIPDLPSSFDKITLQELATHTAGLPFNLPEEIKTATDRTAYLSKTPFAFIPGSQWVYSNVGIGMLGESLQHSTQKEFDNLYYRHILYPLGMKKVGLAVPDKLKMFYAQGYDQQGNPTPASEPGLNPEAYGVKMRAEDMQRFLSAAIGIPGTPERVFYPMRMTEAAYVELSGQKQGLAWQIHTLTGRGVSRLLANADSVELGPKRVIEVLAQPLFDGNALIDKTGTTNGFKAYIAVIPNRKTGIAVLTNKNVNNAAIVGTARELLFKLNGLI